MRAKPNWGTTPRTRRSTFLFTGVGLLLLVLAWVGIVILDTGPPS
jgi:hypothetical protein